jgi:hypothetical protein
LRCGPQCPPRPTARSSGTPHRRRLRAQYRRREPEKTVLHQVVRDELDAFLACARERSERGRGLPGLSSGSCVCTSTAASWPGASPEFAVPTAGSSGWSRSRAKLTCALLRDATADLLEKVFAIDVLACPECGGRLLLIAFIPDSQAAKRILDHFGLDATGPPAAPPRSAPEHFEPAPGYDLADPVYEG